MDIAVRSNPDAKKLPSKLHARVYTNTQYALALATPCIFILLTIALASKGLECNGPIFSYRASLYIAIPTSFLQSFIAPIRAIKIGGTVQNLAHVCEILYSSSNFNGSDRGNEGLKERSRDGDVKRGAIREDRPITFESLRRQCNCEKDEYARSC